MEAVSVSMANPNDTSGKRPPVERYSKQQWHLPLSCNYVTKYDLIESDI